MRAGRHWRRWISGGESGSLRLLQRREDIDNQHVGERVFRQKTQYKHRSMEVGKSVNKELWEQAGGQVVGGSQCQPPELELS